MKIYILKEQDGYQILDFEYSPPASINEPGKYLLPDVPYMRTEPGQAQYGLIQAAVDAGTQNEQWVPVVDLRGKLYWLDGIKHVIEKIGEDIPEGASLTPSVQPPTKQQLLDSITVTTQSGKTFDGDELSQTRIARALQIGQFTGQTATAWKLSDNTVQQVTYFELQEALALAMIEVGRIVGAIE